MTQSFRTTIFKAGINPCVDVPAGVSAALGRKGYIPVECRINGHAFRSGLVSLGGGRHRLFINGEMRREAGVEAGDTIEVRLRYDSEPRSLPLPGELARALRADRTAPRMKAHLRIARPSDHLEEIVAMYREGLGLEELGSFRDHDGFDGVMLGIPGADHHFEFTRRHGEEAGRAPTAENLLVFYLPDRAKWAAACARMRAAGFQQVSSHNPYWDRRGRTFEDVDGYRVVLQCSTWPKEEIGGPARA